MLTFLLALTVPVTTVALLYARWEYRKRGKLTVSGLVLLCAMLLMPNLVLEYATTYEMPSTLLDYVGVVVGSVGVALCLVSIALFRSVLKVLCIDAGKLTTAGPYQWSRNPQYTWAGSCSCSDLRSMTGRCGVWRLCSRSRSVCIC